MKEGDPGWSVFNTKFNKVPGFSFSMKQQTIIADNYDNEGEVYCFRLQKC